MNVCVTCCLPTHSTGEGLPVGATWEHQSSQNDSDPRAVGEVEVGQGLGEETEMEGEINKVGDG